jgi:hypothetical protein
MNQDTPYAVALQVVGIVVILAGIVDPVGESLSPVGAWLIPSGSLLVAGGAVAYANLDAVESVFGDAAGMGDGPPDEDSESGPFENAAYRVGSSGGDAWTWSFEVQDRILAIGTIQYPSRDAAVGAVKRFRRAGEDLPVTDADEEISEFTGKLLEQAPAGDEAGDDGAPRRYYVVHENGEWKVRLESGPVIESLGSDRNGAIRRARELGRRNDRSVMVNYKDGRLGAAYFDETEL